MKYDPLKHHRRSIRLKSWDYAAPGAYFVTVCAHQRAEMFGEVVGGEMRLNEYGQIAADEWRRSAVIRAEIQLDEWVVMPNHIHGIIIIINDPGAGVTGIVGADGRPPLPAESPTPAAPESTRRQPRSIGSFIAGFKSIVTKRINETRAAPGLPVWQRNYYEHIIRSERELAAIRRYIRNNPMQWALDRDNAGNRTGGSRPAPTDLD